MLLVATYLPNQEGGVENDTGNNQHEKDYAKNKQGDFASVEQNPADVQCYSQRHQAGAQRNEEGYRLAATANCHTAIVSEQWAVGSGQSAVRSRQKQKGSR